MFRYRVITTIFILLTLIVIGILGSGAALTKTPDLEAYNLSNLIRLHVIANSDSSTDQYVKLKVRDKIIQATEPLLIRIENPQQAEKILVDNLPRIKRIAREELARQGRPMDVNVQYGRFQFPKRVYPFGILPAGEYKGVRITLGKGAGHNWWCILYPPLCLLNPDAPEFKKSLMAKNPKIEYRLALLENLVRHKNLPMDRFWARWGKAFGMF